MRGDSRNKQRSQKSHRLAPIHLKANRRLPSFRVGDAVANTGKVLPSTGAEGPILLSLVVTKSMTKKRLGEERVNFHFHSLSKSG